MSERAPVVITLCVKGETDRDPWEWADGIASYLADGLNEAQVEGWPAIAVVVDDVQ